MGLGPSRNSSTDGFEITTTDAELLGIKKVCGIDVVVRTEFGCQVPCLRTRFGGPITWFFALFVLLRLPYHNVLYDTSVTFAVKARLPQLEGIAKTELSPAIRREERPHISHVQCDAWGTIRRQPRACRNLWPEH